MVVVGGSGLDREGEQYGEEISSIAMSTNLRSLSLTSGFAAGCDSSFAFVTFSEKLWAFLSLSSK